MGAGIGRNLAKPENGFYGWLAIGFMKKRNTYLEVNAARLCQIKPEYKVLEVGFGVGKGLESAYSYVKDGSGIVYGTDISDKMREMAGENLKKQIAVGKVVLRPYSVDNMKFEDKMFDCVFHCNSLYFWPDMDKAVAELNRVMKPGAIIVTTMKPERLQKLADNGMMIGNIDRNRYINALKANNFSDITNTDHMDTAANDSFLCISAKSAEN